MDILQVIKNSSHITCQELEALNMIFESLKPPYKDYVLFDLEKRILFDTKKQNKATIMLKLQDSIITLANLKAGSARLDTKGQFITEYEALRFKRKYFIAEILNIKEAGIKFFLQELVERAME